MINLVKNMLSKKVKYPEGKMDIIHDIKTPLASLKNGMDGVFDRLGILIDTYEMASKAGLSVPVLYPQELDSLKKSLLLSKNDIYLSGFYINFLSDILIDFEHYNPDPRILFARDSLKKILHLFPVKNKSQRNLLCIDYDFNDFEFIFDENLFNAIIITITRFATKIVERYDMDGDFSIKTECLSKYNRIDFDIEFNGDQHDCMAQFKNDSWFEYCRLAVRKAGKFKTNVINNGIRCSLFLNKVE